ncbi:unnamed protein product [Protopolystoma xenopodis]|uniref:Uncharacterized protein n=1 Tax=Protopolystoma xenopodis TaxID=117903 RepID=A0A3S5FGB8_9PLAT|nr:unnamed protein product [Protopolystoma xenopodis]
MTRANSHSSGLLPDAPSDLDSLDLTFDTRSARRCLAGDGELADSDSNWATLVMPLTKEVRR